MHILYAFFICLYVCSLLLVPGLEGFQFENKGELFVTDTIFERWNFVVANDIEIRNGSGNNIAVRRIYSADLKTSESEHNYMYISLHCIVFIMQYQQCRTITKQLPNCVKTQKQALL